MAREAAAYAEMHAALWQTIPGKWIAIYEGRIVDQDDDPRALYLRVRDHFGEIPVMICQVGPSLEEEIWIRPPAQGGLSRTRVGHVSDVTILGHATPVTSLT